MGIIIDLILIAVVLLSAFLGYKKGLVKLGAKLFAGIIAIVLTLILYRPVSGTIIKNTPIVEKIKNVVIENSSNFENQDKDKVSTQITNQVKNEILPAEAFYSFSAKYQNSDSKTVESPDLPEELTKKVRELAVKAYKAADCQGLSRVDFFVDDKENKIYINEINTLPGFTEISMYPKLWEKSGLTYTELLDKLIELAY